MAAIAAWLVGQGVEPGDRMEVFDTDCGRIGILICYDSEFPELARICAEQNMHILFVPFHGTLTREAYVPQERIVDHSTTGVTYAFTVKPADAGTTLIMEVGVSSRVPFLDKVEDKVFWKGDRDLDKYLGIYKKAIEA